MLILLTIFLLIFIPFIMVILHLVRPRFGIQGFLAILAVLAGLPMVYLTSSNLPQVIPLLQWEPIFLFPDSPSLLVDQISWYFSLALVSLSLALIITSIAHLGQSYRAGHEPVSGKPEPAAGETRSTPVAPPRESNESVIPDQWRSWAGILVLTSLGLLAVSAGNLLTLLLAWIAVDLVELIILLGNVLDSKARERIILAFTSRMAAIGVVLMAGIIPWSQGSSLSFEAITPSTSIYLILAAGLRLGVLPLHLPHSQQIPLRRGLGAILRMVPAASSYILLVRMSYIGILGPATIFLLALTVLAGLYAAVRWLNARDELNGRPFWLLGSASLAVAAAILSQPLACLAWSLASLLSGGLIFSMSLRHKHLLPMAVLGLVNFSALPFTPAWSGTLLYSYQASFSSIIPVPLFYLFSLIFLLIHATLLMGYFRHILRGIVPSGEQPAGHIERWVWLLYPTGLVIISVTHFLTGFPLQPELGDVPLTGWLLGVVTVAVASAGGYLYWRQRIKAVSSGIQADMSAWSRIISMDWLYRLLWGMFRLMARLISMLSAILEGEGGILWALVLFALIFVFLQR